MEEEIDALFQRRRSQRQAAEPTDLFVARERTPTVGGDATQAVSADTLSGIRRGRDDIPATIPIGGLSESPGCAVVYLQLVVRLSWNAVTLPFASSVMVMFSCTM